MNTTNKVTFKHKRVKSILNKSKIRDSWFLDDYTVNPYSACSFNCLYCYIRGSKYGEHMGMAMEAKINAPDLLRKQLSFRYKKRQFGFIVFSSATDPYVKPERELELTRQCLEVIRDFKFPIHLLTKSDMILRDLDLLHEIQEQAILPKDIQGKLPGVVISFSFSTTNDHLGKIFESGATPPSQRIETLKTVLSHHFYSGISLMPLLPFITDNAEQLENYYSTFSSLGAKYIMPSTLTLFGGQKADSKTLMFNAVKKHFPELLPRYEKLFTDGSNLPSYYRKAFGDKVNSLAEKYGIPNRILPKVS